MKKTGLLIITCVLLAGCSSNGVAGTYYYKTEAGNFVDDTYFELNEDGTCSMVTTDGEQACTYGNGLLTVNGESASYTIKKNVMTLTLPGSGGSSMTFEKK